MGISHAFPNKIAGGCRTQGSLGMGSQAVKHSRPLRGTHMGTNMGKALGHPLPERHPGTPLPVPGDELAGAPAFLHSFGICCG